MTRLTFAVAGDPLTFRPVTSSIVRQSKDGPVNVVIMLFGTHYNVHMGGILQQNIKGDIDENTASMLVNNGFLELKAELETAGVTIAELIGTFSSFMYFYPGLKIEGHLKLSETTHATPVPVFEGQYRFKDLLSEDELQFVLSRGENNLTFKLVEIVDGVSNDLFTEALAGGVTEVYFEFVFLERGKSKLYFFSDYGTQNQTKTRKWIGDTDAKVGECNVTIRHLNAEEDLKTVSSDLILLKYPEIFLKFDREDDQLFVGRIKMWDDNNDPVEDNWSRVRSRDHKFVGNRVIENGMIRVIIKTTDPIMEIWGWNFNTINQWEKSMTILLDSDNDVKPLKIQNVVFEFFNDAQVKVEFNFGTSIYSFLMTRGDPYITVLNKQKTKLKFESDKNRFVGDFKDQHNGYTLKNTAESGNPITKKASGTATCTSVVAGNTITINGVQYTAVTGAKADNTEFSVDGGDNACAADLADSINNDVRVGTDEPDITVDATVNNNVVTIEAAAGGISGNNITLAQTGGNITLSGGVLTGGAATGGSGTESLTNFLMNDNWVSVYNHDVSNEIVGWISNMFKPTQIDITELGGKVQYVLTYPIKGGVFGVGVLPSFPSNQVGGVPFPFVVGTQDKYVKWRANEALLAFKEVETFKRR